jgi:hypothetical protein
LKVNEIMKKLVLLFLLLLPLGEAFSQDRSGLTLMPPVDSVPNRIPDFLQSSIFIPRARLVDIHPWTSAPLPVPVVKVIPVNGFNGSIGFGTYSISHPDKFFSTLDGYNTINIPHMYITQQMMIGNTFKLAKNLYMLSGILYGAQLGVMGNNWGMGNREGFIWHPSAIISITLWNQYFQSVSVYSPVLYPNANGDGAAVRMPATPEVFSFGVQASFVVGEFIIDVGASVAPVPYQKRHHSELHYK